MTSEPEPAPFAYAGLDRLFHERARLGIVTSLAGNPGGLAFTELKRLCGLTDGNLSRHLAALEEAEYVVIDKRQAQRRLVTTCRLTPLGREKFTSYLAVLETALKEGTRATLRAGCEQVSGHKA